MEELRPGGLVTDSLLIHDLYINDSWEICEEYGIRMGDNFLNNLTEPLSMKAYVENESRLEHGKRIEINEPRFQSREVTLDFTISGDTKDDFLANKKAFLELLYEGEITIAVPKATSEVFRLIYTGKSGEYGMNLARTFCHMSLKFVEPDPSYREPKGVEGGKLELLT